MTQLPISHAPSGCSLYLARPQRFQPEALQSKQNFPKPLRSQKARMPLPSLTRTGLQAINYQPSAISLSKLIEAFNYTDGRCLRLDPFSNFQIFISLSFNTIASPVRFARVAYRLGSNFQISRQLSSYLKLTRRQS